MGHGFAVELSKTLPTSQHDYIVLYLCMPQLGGRRPARIGSHGMRSRGGREQIAGISGEGDRLRVFDLGLSKLRSAKGA